MREEVYGPNVKYLVVGVPVGSRFVPLLPEKQACIVDKLTLCVTPSECLAEVGIA